MLLADDFEERRYEDSSIKGGLIFRPVKVSINDRWAFFSNKLRLFFDKVIERIFIKMSKLFWRKMVDEKKKDLMKLYEFYCFFFSFQKKITDKIINFVSIFLNEYRVKEILLFHSSINVFWKFHLKIIVITIMDDKNHLL